MNEKQYIDAIEKMRREGLCKTSPESACRYAARLRADSELSTMLRKEGILAEGESLLDLSADNIDRLNKLNQWQATRALDDKSKAALKLLLKLHKITPMSKHSAQRIYELSAVPNSLKNDSNLLISGAVTLKQNTLKEIAFADRNSELPLSLYGLLSALRQATKNRRIEIGEPAYTVIMRALLQRKDFYWSVDTTDTDLRIWGSRYAENADLILANLHDPIIRESVLSDLESALLDLEDMVTGPQLRIDIARACAYVKNSTESKIALFPLLAEKYSVSQAKALLSLSASMEKGLGAAIYSDISDSELSEKLAELFVLAIEAADGNFTPACDFDTALAVLDAEERAMLAVASCGLPISRTVLKKGKRKEILADLAERNLFIIEGNRLIPAADSARLPLTELISADGTLKSCDSADLLFELLKKSNADDVPEKLRENLLSDLKELLPHLSFGKARSEVLRFLMHSYWKECSSQIPQDAISALDQIITQTKKYPSESDELLFDMLGGSASDAELRLMRHNGVNLLQAELLSTCAQRCLEIALDSEANSLTFPHSKSSACSVNASASYPALCAVSKAKEALQISETIHHTRLTKDTLLTLALALASAAASESALSEQDWPHSTAALVKDFVLPCAEAIEYTEKICAESCDAADSELLASVKNACIQQLDKANSLLKKHSELFDFDYRSNERFCSRYIYEQLLEPLQNAEKENKEFFFSLIHRQSRPADMFLPWYCSSFDSTLACGPECTQERTEAALLNILLSGQKITMSANQLADNEMMWNLSENPAFLWLLRRGLVNLSLFAGVNSLSEYAQTRMENPIFRWSSLPEDFEKPELRKVAADFFAAKLSAAQLPSEYRTLLEKMRNAIRTIDENLSSCHCDYYHQQNSEFVLKRGIKALIPLPRRLHEYYCSNRTIEHYDIMQRLNRMISETNPNFDRSTYRKIIAAVRSGDFAGLESLNISSESIKNSELDLEYIGNECLSMLDNMILISDDCHNRMLGECISTYQYYIYDEKSALIIPERSEPSSSAMINESGRLLYRQTEQAIKNSGTLIGWQQVPELLSELEQISREYPDSDAERLCTRLANRGLGEYDTFGLSGSIRLKNLAFRATSGTAVKREYAQDTGELYNVERSCQARK